MSLAAIASTAAVGFLAGLLGGIASLFLADWAAKRITAQAGRDAAVYREAVAKIAAGLVNLPPLDPDEQRVAEGWDHRG